MLLMPDYRMYQQDSCNQHSQNGLFLKRFLNQGERQKQGRNLSVSWGGGAYSYHSCSVRLISFGINLENNLLLIKLVEKDANT